jgi:HK97 gp10 family phage protein
MTSVEITGRNKQRDIIKKFGNPNLYDKALHDIVEDTAQLMRNFAPVRTGKLEESIKVNKKGNNEYEIVVDVPHAIYMEWGTTYFPVGEPDRPRVRESTETGKIAYHPFMRTAIWIMDKEYSKYFKRILYYK